MMLIPKTHQPECGNIPAYEMCGDLESPKSEQTVTSRSATVNPPLIFQVYPLLRFLKWALMWLYGHGLLPRARTQQIYDYLNLNSA